MGRRLLGCVRDRLGQSSGADLVTLTVSLRGAVTDRGAPRVPWKCVKSEETHLLGGQGSRLGAWLMLGNLHISVKNYPSF